MSDEIPTKRKYELKQRAAEMAETRLRITEAAVELHGTIGPARTTVSAVAELAGVQRHTYYRHFPDERSLVLACSGLYTKTNPMPDPEPWREIDDLEQRLRHGLGELYAYYERNVPMLSNVTRDAEVDPVIAEIGRIRMDPSLGAMRAVLANGRRSKRLLALLDVALGFSTWRTLTRDSGLSRKEAVEAMVAAIRCVRSV
jgi:AcrR family transcriptional regulator